MGSCNKLEPSSARFPYCVVWTPIPVVTWLVPFVGHLGVCSSSGVIFDFAGPYFVSVDNFAFGRTARYLLLSTEHAESLAPEGSSGGRGPSVAEQWDALLEETAEAHRGIAYNFCGHNCHEFVADFLNSLRYRGFQRWNMVSLAVMMLFRGRFVGVGAALKTFLPFAVLGSVAGYYGRWTALVAWGSVVGSLTAWFLLYTYARLLLNLLRRP
mmetsp:Transcript_33956/g.80618  ORF Transcript_33956/g.80618 Transcript_33956/m.80618 type:complete len:212 (+) Transcript_33956:189-824(+)